MKALPKTDQLISIVMPVYNTVRFLPAAIKSLQRQTHRHWQLIIVDDHSQDGSWQLAQAAAAADPRIQVYRNRVNRGVSYTANRAIKYAAGQFIARMDSDDIATPHRFAKQLAYLQQHQQVVAVGGQCQVIDETGRVIGHKRFPTRPSQVARMLFTFASMQQPTMMVNTALLPADFVWYESGLAAAEEHELLFRLLQYGQLANLPHTLLQYRMHTENTSSRHPKRDFGQVLKARWRAVRHHHYRPDWRGIFATLAQAGVVGLLPESLLYQLYTFLRGWRAPVPLAAEALETARPVGPAKRVSKLTSLSVFFPMHNEAENITRVVQQAQKVLPTVARRYEIIIVNDGSQDRTSTLAHQLARRDRHLRVIDQPHLGYGGALRTGFAAARYDWVFFADGDLQFDLRELSHFIPATVQHAAVLGYRLERADHWTRRLLARLLKLWNTVFFQFPRAIKDIDCAFKLIRRDVLLQLLPLHSRGALISTELILKLVESEASYTQVGVHHYPRHYGQQTGARWDVIYGAVKETFWLLRQRWQLPSWPRLPLRRSLKLGYTE